MKTSVKKEHCNTKYIIDGVFGVMTFLTAILQNQAFLVAGEEKSMELFILVTSPDRLDDPRKGSELWDHLKESFPANNGGIDSERVSKEMAQIFLKEMGM